MSEIVRCPECGYDSGNSVREILGDIPPLILASCIGCHYVWAFDHGHARPMREYDLMGYGSTHRAVLAHELRLWEAGRIR